MKVSRVSLSIVLSASLGCGSSAVSTAAGTPARTDDAGPLTPSAGDGGTPALDGGAADPGDTGLPDPGAGPAHAPLPQFVYGPSVGDSATAGPLLASVEIVTATWDKAPTSDPLSAQLNAFGATLAQGTWWDAVRAGYCKTGTTSCVGPGGTAVSHGVGDTPNPAITDTAFSATGNWSFKKFINDKTTAGDLPTPGPSTLYVFYLPPGFSVTLDGSPTCGYHSVATVNVADAGTMTIPYVVIPRCQVTGMADLDVATVAASREIIEATTDPYLGEAEIGFYLDDPAWSVTGSEIGDYCAAQTTTESASATSVSSVVQRIWSNPSAAGGHDPCVPIPSGEIFYDVAPPANVAAGITLALGASTTFTATAFADGAMGTWAVASQQLSPTTVLDVSLDKTTVKDGDTVEVTVTLTGTPAARLASRPYERFALVSSGGDGRTHSWPIIVYAE